MQEDMPVPPAPALHRSNTPDEAPQRSDTVLDLGISALVLSDSTRPRPLRRQRAVAFELPVPEEVAAPRNLQRSDTVLELPSSQSTPVPSEPRPLRRQHAVVFAPTATEAAPRNLQCSDTLLDLPSSSSTHPPSECTTPRALRRQHAVAFEEFEAPEVPTKRPRRSNTPSLPSTPAPSESTSPRPDAPTFDVEAVDRALLRIQRTMVGRPIRPLPCRAFAVDVPMLPSITENDVPTRPTSPGHDIPTRPTSPKSEPEPFIPTRPATPIPLPPARTLKRNYATFHALKHQPQTYLQPIPHNASPEPILSALHWKPGNLHVEWNAYETTVLPNGKKGLRIVPDQLGEVDEDWEYGSYVWGEAGYLWAHLGKESAVYRQGSGG
ncbi:hypothetical protein BDQ17DRAFT_1353592 [Cyathus striatus]|nr:hypothetical protein BDQ17DRAFT_1353592 [Cyathus striatus]